MDVYSWGSGNYGRLGLGHSNDARTPHRVAGVLNGCDVAAAACGWYHSAVVTSTGDVAAFGSKVTKCLGIAGGSDSDASEGRTGGMVTSDDDSFSEGEPVDGLRYRGNASSSTPRIPRWAEMRGGREKKTSRSSWDSYGSSEQSSTASFQPMVLRSFPTRVTIVQIAVGGDMLGAHTLAVSRNGRLYSWGYGPACGLGSVTNVKTPTLVTKFLGTGVGEATSGKQEMEPLGWGKHSHMRYRRRAATRQLGLQVLRPRIVKACCGGSFSVVMSSDGEIFTFGLSAGGRLGFRTKFRAQLRPRRIETLSEGAVDCAAGAGFVILCSAAGRLIAWGDNSKGQLGIGHLQESYEPLVIPRACPAAFVFQAVAAGDSHALALDSAGKIYSWGGEGGPMTGQGEPLPNNLQVDLAFKLKLRQLPYWWVRPRPIRALATHRVVHIDAGCMHSVALTQDGMLYAWGAALQVGVASLAGTSRSQRPEVSWLPRLIAPSPKLPLVRVGTVTAGGWHTLVTARPSSPAELMLPRLDGYTDHAARCLCDGVLVSHVDSTNQAEARVLVCCALLRARFSLPDGSDSPIWQAIFAQIVRLQPFASAAPKTDASKIVKRRPAAPKSTIVFSSDSEESGDLMAIVTAHRLQPRIAKQKQAKPLPRSGSKTRKSSSRAKRSSEVVVPSSNTDVITSKEMDLPSHLAPGPGRTSDADEAAGKAVQSIPDKAMIKALKPTPENAPLQGPVSSRSSGRKKPIPDFSSDSTDNDVPPPSASSSQRGSRQGVSARSTTTMNSARTINSARARPLPRHAVPNFSSDSSSDDDARHRKVASARQVKVPASNKELRFDLRKFSEAVLVALVRFLHTDCLEPVEVIDESHPSWHHEQRLRIQPLGPQPGELEKPIERPSEQRAVRGLLLRREVADLRQIAAALGLERLARSCDQLLLRVDAPGAPALFIPDSSLRITMAALFQQTLKGPTQDGADTQIACARMPVGRQRGKGWGLRKEAVPKDGKVFAHAFMLCAGCSWIYHEQQNENSVIQGALCLRRPRRAQRWTRFELDLQEYAVDVVYAWLRYLYTQDDLTLVWPCGDRRVTPEEAAEADAFWLELLRLGQKVGDERLQLYAQDVLVGALSATNWSQMAAFAEQSQCLILSEAALTMGLRILSPAMLQSFQVQTGLECLEKDNDSKPKSEEQSSASNSWDTPVATVVGTPGRPGSVRGIVDLEIEKHLLEHKSAQRLIEPKVLSALKRSSPGQFGELKQRLADSVVSVQQAGAQLQKCAQYYDTQEKQGFQRDGTRGRRLWMELSGLLVLLLFFITPVILRQSALDFVLKICQPLAMLVPSFPDVLSLSSYIPFSETITRVMMVNFLVLCMLVYMIWLGLKAA